MQLTELITVANLTDNLFLIISKEDKSDNPVAVQVDIPARVWRKGELQKFLKFTPYEEVSENKDVQRFYRDRIYRYFKDEEIIEIIKVFGEIE